MHVAILDAAVAAAAAAVAAATDCVLPIKNVVTNARMPTKLLQYVSRDISLL